MDPIGRSGVNRAMSSREHEQTIDALKPPRRARPAIAILALNAGTEACDLLTSYGVLAESGVADVTVVAERSDPIHLYPARLAVEPQATRERFDPSYPAGADYIVVPAMAPHDDPGAIAFIKAQHAKGATIVAVCDGALTLAAAGLLDGRRATGHWYSVAVLRAAHPTMQWVRDRRYVADRGVATSTGITASLPLMIALVEAIGGRGAAQALAMRLGIAGWDAGHDSAAFRLGVAHRITYLRNRLAVWRHGAVAITLDDDVDEIALGLMADAHARTELGEVITVGPGLVRSRRGLHLRPQAPAAAADLVLRPERDAPALTIARELARIAARHGAATAALVALVMEYPWSGLGDGDRPRNATGQ